jgi:hypothetical protein
VLRQPYVMAKRLLIGLPWRQSGALTQNEFS